MGVNNLGSPYYAGVTIVDILGPTRPLRCKPSTSVPDRIKAR